jgi:hypothetical protein
MAGMKSFVPRLGWWGVGDFRLNPLDYDALARRHGQKHAQCLWIRNGGTGPYIPGMTAVSGWHDHNGTVSAGVTEPYRPLSGTD